AEPVGGVAANTDSLSGVEADHPEPAAGRVEVLAAHPGGVVGVAVDLPGHAGSAGVTREALTQDPRSGSDAPLAAPYACAQAAVGLTLAVDSGRVLIDRILVTEETEHPVRADGAGGYPPIRVRLAVHTPRPARRCGGYSVQSDLRASPRP